jgi:hypothetical protein
MGVGRQPSETLEEHARRTARTRLTPSEVPPVLSTLAQDASVASYAAGPLNTEVVSRSVVAAAVIEGAIWKRATRWQRLRWRIDPRQLIRLSGRDGGWNRRDPDRRPGRRPRSQTGGQAGRDWNDDSAMLAPEAPLSQRGANARGVSRSV